MKSSAMRIVVAGTLFDGADRGGSTWTALQYVLGLRRLGHDVLFVTEEGRESVGVPLERTPGAEYLRRLGERFGLQGRVAMLRPATREGVGVPYDEALRLCRSADLLLNLAGAARDPALLEAVRCRAWVELDPARTAARHGGAPDALFGAHDHFFTTALGASSDDCSLRTGGVAWIPTPPPVVLEEWPVEGTIRYHAFTAIGGRWRDVGVLEPYLSVPSRAHARFLLAVSTDRDERPLDLLRRNGWALVDPGRIAGTADSFRAFVQGSLGGLGPIRPSHAKSQSGWLGSHAACYLASGRPVLVHDTGCGDHISAGVGLLPFSDGEDVVRGVEAFHSEYPRHAKAARGIAETHLDSDRVLARMLDAVDRDATGVTRTA